MGKPKKLSDTLGTYHTSKKSASRHQTSARICSTVKISTQRLIVVTDQSLCITPQLHQVSQSNTLDNKVKAHWLHCTALTLLPMSSRLLPGLLLLSLMEGERSRFLIRLVIVDPSTDIISRCQKGIYTHPPNCAWGTSPGLKQKY